MYIIFLTFLAGTCILQNCEVTSPSVGTIRVSCDSSHQIQVNVICPNNCNPVVISSGNSPLTVMGLDPGRRYTVIIHVFDGNQVVLTNEKITKTIIVISTTSSKIVCSMQTVIRTVQPRGNVALARNIFLVTRTSATRTRYLPISF